MIDRKQKEDLISFYEAYEGLKKGKVYMAYEYCSLNTLSCNLQDIWIEKFFIKLIDNEIQYFSSDESKFKNIKYYTSENFIDKLIDKLDAFFTLKYQEAPNPELDPAIIVKRLNIIESNIRSTIIIEREKGQFPKAYWLICCAIVALAVVGISIMHIV